MMIEEIRIPWPSLLKSAESLSAEERIIQLSRIRDIIRGIIFTTHFPNKELGMMYIQFDYWMEPHVLQWKKYKFYLVRYAAALSYMLVKEGKGKYEANHWKNILRYVDLDNNLTPKEGFNILKKCLKPDFVNEFFHESSRPLI